MIFFQYKVESYTKSIRESKTRFILKCLITLHDSHELSLSRYNEIISFISSYHFSNFLIIFVDIVDYVDVSVRLFLLFLSLQS